MNFLFFFFLFLSDSLRLLPRIAGNNQKPPKSLSAEPCRGHAALRPSLCYIYKNNHLCWIYCSLSTQNFSMSTSSWGRFSRGLFPLSVPRAGKWGAREANGLGSSTRSPPPAPPVPACSENKTPSAPGAAAGAGSTPPARSPPCRNTWPRLSRPCGGKAGGTYGAGSTPCLTPAPYPDPRWGHQRGRFPPGTAGPARQRGLGANLCSSAATTKPQDASSEQTDEYRVL